MKEFSYIAILSTDKRKYRICYFLVKTGERGAPPSPFLSPSVTKGSIQSFFIFITYSSQTSLVKSTFKSQCKIHEFFSQGLPKLGN